MAEYSYSTDEEHYNGTCSTISEAVDEGLQEAIDCGQAVFWVGENVAPTPPEEFWRTGDWIEHVDAQDEYCNEWAEGWCCPTKGQEEELETEVRAVIRKWLERHDLQPKFYSVTKTQEYRIENGKAVEA